mmetsp:Transcript_9908/g.26921  ORF Transcript_9908/g.26921 Transcript_9908/m.26921 type:complete len:201 (-) Transcript_9908:203-805(-)
MPACERRIWRGARWRGARSARSPPGRGPRHAHNQRDARAASWASRPRRAQVPVRIGRVLISRRSAKTRPIRDHSELRTQAGVTRGGLRPTAMRSTSRNVRELSWPMTPSVQTQQCSGGEEEAWCCALRHRRRPPCPRCLLISAFLLTGRSQAPPAAHLTCAREAACTYLTPFRRTPLVVRHGARERRRAGCVPGRERSRP